MFCLERDRLTASGATPGETAIVPGHLRTEKRSRTMKNKDSPKNKTSTSLDYLNDKTPGFGENTATSVTDNRKKAIDGD